MVEQLESIFRVAFRSMGIADAESINLQESTRVEFGDYQVNGVMKLAKNLKINPRVLAQQIIDLVDPGVVISQLEVAGPGFINITLNPQFLVDYLNGGIVQIKPQEQLVVIDYSAPNLAKEMHVGHLRSTVIGDALVRIYEYLGNRVIRRNHVGDWGTQFGMLTAYLMEVSHNSNADLELHDLEVFYQKAKLRFDADPNFAQRSREYVVRLQSGDTEVLTLWRKFVTISLSHCQEICERLGTKLTLADAVGESSYNDLLAPLLKRLVASGIAKVSAGAVCVFFEPQDLGFKEETPFILQKKDGGYLYAATDVAALYDRVHNLQAQRLVYVIDARQSLHLQQLFALAKKSGLANPDTVLQHAAFGTMMGTDGKPFKTRSGGTVKLLNLIDEAQLRARDMVAERHPEWNVEEINALGDVIAIAALKYADLAKNRSSDYVFSFDKMLAFEGNTAPYLLYAYTRINSIFIKAGLTISNFYGLEIGVSTPEEHGLAVHLARFAERLLQTAKENYPHYLCGYAYDLAGLFMKFYEACPILNANDATLRDKRLALAALTAKTLQISLGLLGIPIVERM